MNIVDIKASSFRANVEVGGGIALWKSALITAATKTGGAAAQIELRGVADRRRLDLHSCIHIHKRGTHQHFLINF